MSRRKKDPEPPRSGSWETYRPQDDLYWKFGGPTVPVADIPPDPYPTTYVATHFKDSTQRAAHVATLIENYEKALAESVAYYLRLAELGIDAMKYEFYRDQDREQDASGNWAMVARNVDRHRASSFRSIAMRKGQIDALRKLLADIEAVKLPLLFGRGRDLFDT